MSIKAIIDGWEKAIKASEQARKPWHDTAKMCREFYSGSVSFMWGKGFRDTYLKNLPESKFQITIAKAFELVSIVGPTLMWASPGRVATGYQKLEIPMDFWPDPQMGMMWQQEYQLELAQNTARNNLMQHYLNYSPREQPGGGLVVESQIAIIDSLVTGRGVIRVDAYEPEGGTGTLTGGFYVPVDNLFIDPDCTRPNMRDAKWIVIRHLSDHYDLERRFGWASGSLKGHAKQASKKAAMNADKLDTSARKNESVHDLVEWYEVFSKCGAGHRFKTVRTQHYEAFEQIGDFCYICFVPGMAEPLNLKQAFMETADISQVKAALDWPTPYYLDGRWPVAVLDYWLNPGKAWPLAPLAMGLGELIFLNVFISSLADKIFQDGLVKAAIKSELAEEAIQKLLSYQHEVIELNSAIAGNINELVSYLQRPQTNMDAFRMVEYVSQMFDKRVGLTEAMYGLNPGGKVTRTAMDAQLKGEAISVRPEFMSTRVEAWQTEIANLERIAAGYHVSAQTLTPLLGQMGSQLWDQLITRADPVIYMREMRCQLEANSVRKPNKAKDNQNLQQMSGILLPMLQWYAQGTGNTEPLNNYIMTLGKAIEQDVEGWLLPPLNQQQEQGPTPEEIEAMEIEKAKKIADIQNRDLKNKRLAHENMEAGIGLPADMAGGITPSSAADVDVGVPDHMLPNDDPTFYIPPV
jgi:hypothetical protein